MSEEWRSSEGWVDIHAHVTGIAGIGVDPTQYGVAQGVEVLVDAGSAPPAELGRCLREVNAATETAVLAWANICAEGIYGKGCAGHDISGEAARRALREHSGQVVGIKLQASSTRLAERGLEAIENAKRVAAASAAGGFGVPLLVHVGNGPPTIREVADALRQGDIITHFAHGKPEGALGEDGRPHPALVAARQRGVLFDVGHGAGSFAFDVMERLGAAGFWPDIISTDLHRGSAVAPVGSLADCVSKLVSLGMPEVDALAAVTARPRAALGLPPGRMRTRFRVSTEPWEACDTYGNSRRLRYRIVNAHCEPADG
jgi:dihydroorotase